VAQDGCYYSDRTSPSSNPPQTDMATEGLHEALEELRSQINSGDVNSADFNQRINSLITQIEAKAADDTEQSSNSGLLKSLKDAVNTLEAEHPQATSVLNRIMMSLGDTGI
jgi:seryl-tRNA synthetase